MSESSAFGFGQFVPGFDFLQNLSKTAAQAAPATGAVPGMASWVAPTLSVEELDKRIQELKAVQFWLGPKCHGPQSHHSGHGSAKDDLVHVAKHEREHGRFGQGLYGQSARIRSPICCRA